MSNYVDISQKEFEGWLDSFHLEWSRVPGKEGVYLLHLSSIVAVKIHSSVGSRDRGKGSMSLSLVSLETRQTLKTMGQSRFHRTTRWRVNWRKGVDTFKGAYVKKKSFYDKLATFDPQEYKEHWLLAIEGLPNWERSAFLQDLHRKVSRGWTLSDKQEKDLKLQRRSALRKETPTVLDA